MSPARLRCPNCGTETTVRGEQTVCAGCHTRYPTAGLYRGGVEPASDDVTEKEVERLRFVWPWSLYVSANARLGWVEGQMRSQREYREKMGLAHLKARAQMQGDGFGDAPIRAHVKAWMPDKRRRDVTNVPKLFLDCLEGVAYEDDVQVRELTVEHMGTDRDEPRVVVYVERIEANEEAA